MDKNKIKKIYNGKIQNLVKLNKHYYDLSKPLVNDYEYDQIKAEIPSILGSALYSNSFELFWSKKLLIFF